MRITISVELTKISVELATPDLNVMQWSHPCSLCWAHHQSHPNGPPDLNVIQWSHPCSLCWAHHQSHPNGPPDLNVIQWSHPCSLCWAHHQSHPNGLSWQLTEHHIVHRHNRASNA
jgi:hypothetical protein